MCTQFIHIVSQRLTDSNLAISTHGLKPRFTSLGLFGMSWAGGLPFALGFSRYLTYILKVLHVGYYPTLRSIGILLAGGRHPSSTLSSIPTYM